MTFIMEKNKPKGGCLFKTTYHNQELFEHNPDEYFADQKETADLVFDSTKDESASYQYIFTSSLCGGTDNLRQNDVYLVEAHCIEHAANIMEYKLIRNGRTSESRTLTDWCCPVFKA